MKSEKVRKFFGLCPKNNDIRLRRVKVLRSESFVFLVSLKEEREEKTGFTCCLFVQIITRLFPDMCREKTPREPRTRRRKRGSRGENRGIHGRDPCRLTWAISGDFRLVVLGILLYSCVLRTKTRSKIAPWQVQRSFARRICAKAMKRPQTIRSLLARALKMHRCKSVGQNRHVSLPCMP